MAQKPKSGMELSFHKGSKRWCKSYTIDGRKKTKYFCHGSMHRALEHYFEQWMVGEVVSIDGCGMTDQ